MGANSCGQLGQHYVEMKQSDAEEIFMSKPSELTGQSFGTYLETSSIHSLDNDNSTDSKIEDGNSEIDKLDPAIGEEDSLRMIEGSVQTGAIPHLNIFEEKQKESVSLVPRLIKSLMHLRVNKISSGGVHNICIVEPYPNHLNSDLYKWFMKNKYTDVWFAFKERSYSIKDPNIDLEKLNEAEETKNEMQIVTKTKNKLRKGLYERRIWAHKFILASKSPIFEEMFSKNILKYSPEKKDDNRLSSENGVDYISVKECNYKAFKLILDYIYLENLDILDDVTGWNELTEILKLAKQYQLPELQEKWESQLLSLPSIQLFRNLITNSSQINSFLKRNKEKKNIGGRNYNIEGDQEISKSAILDSFDPTTIPSVSQDPELVQRRNAYPKKLVKKSNENLDGVMFLADGRILVVNNELYQEIMKKGIIIDLNDKGKMRGDFDGKDNFSSNDEESKEYVHSHNKSENPRSVTQSKKLKKSVTNSSSVSAQTKKSITNAESSVESSDQNKVYLPILRKKKLRMFESKDSMDSSPKSTQRECSYSDIILSIDGKEIYAHRAVLWSRSTYFEAMFSHDFKESDKTKIVLKNIASFEMFCNLLEYMYSDDKPINIRSVFDMLNLADEYGVTSFKEKWEIMLSKYVTVSTVWIIFKYANEFNWERLKETWMIYMKENYDEVIYSSGFEELDKDEMLKIIRLGKEK